jgi:hypothetical protein
VSVISPVMAISPRTGRPVSSDASATTIVTPAEGPSDYGIADLDFRRISGGLLVQTLDFESKRGCEILFIADHDVNERRKFAINLTCARLTANRLPEGFAIVQIVRNDRSMTSRRFHCFAGNGRSRFR